MPQDATQQSVRESRFWQQWLLIGTIGGIAGSGVLALLCYFVAILVGRPLAVSTTATGYTLIQLWGLIGLIPAGLYGCSQGIAQRLFLRQQTPKLRRSIQVHFSALVVAMLVNGGGLLALLLVRNAVGDVFRTLMQFGLPLLLITAGFIVGGFGGIAQAIVTRFVLRSIVHDHYLRWILPLALWGHISGGLAGAIGCLSVSVAGEWLLPTGAG